MIILRVQSNTNKIDNDWLISLLNISISDWKTRPASESQLDSALHQPQSLNHRASQPLFLSLHTGSWRMYKLQNYRFGCPRCSWRLCTSVISCQCARFSGWQTNCNCRWFLWASIFYLVLNLWDKYVARSVGWERYTLDAILLLVNVIRLRLQYAQEFTSCHRWCGHTVGNIYWVFRVLINGNNNKKHQMKQCSGA